MEGDFAEREVRVITLEVGVPGAHIIHIYRDLVHVLGQAGPVERGRLLWASIVSIYIGK
jgi:hypothetical protein